MCFASVVLALPPSPVPTGLEAHRATHRERRRAIGWLRWWCYYLIDAGFRLEEEGLAIAAEIRSYPPALRSPVFKAEQRRLMTRHHRWAADDPVQAECAILRHLSPEELAL